MRPIKVTMRNTLALTSLIGVTALRGACSGWLNGSEQACSGVKAGGCRACAGGRRGARAATGQERRRHAPGAGEGGQLLASSADGRGEFLPRRRCSFPPGGVHLQLGPVPPSPIAPFPTGAPAREMSLGDRLLLRML
ncbi:hypothetical protein MTO96_013314 [Rhipicephalus appendiculatus]